MYKKKQIEIEISSKKWKENYDLYVYCSCMWIDWFENGWQTANYKLPSYFVWHYCFRCHSSAFKQKRTCFVVCSLLLLLFLFFVVVVMSQSKKLIRRCNYVQRSIICVSMCVCVFFENCRHSFVVH